MEKQLGCKIDLVSRSALRQEMKEEILQEAIDVTEIVANPSH